MFFFGPAYHGNSDGLPAEDSAALRARVYSIVSDVRDGKASVHEGAQLARCLEMEFNVPGYVRGAAMDHYWDGVRNVVREATKGLVVSQRNTTVDDAIRRIHDAANVSPLRSKLWMDYL